MRIHNDAEARAWLNRIATLPDYYATETANMRRGLATGFVSPAITATTAAKATRAQAKLPPEQSPLLQPFDTLPAAMQPERDALREQALELIRTRCEARRGAPGRLPRRRLPAPRARQASALPRCRTGAPTTPIGCGARPPPT